MASSVSIEAPRDGTGRHGGLYFGLRRLDARLAAVVVLHHSEDGRQTMREVMGLTDADVEAALTDQLSGWFG